MSLGRLLLSNLLYHGRGNFAVFCGVVVGSVVLTGALLVGDSLRGSLRDKALRRLGWVEDALVSQHFFRTRLASDLLSAMAVKRCHPAILLQATASAQGPGAAGVSKARSVTVLGIDEGFWAPSDYVAFGLRAPLLWLNSTLASDLGVSGGDEVTLLLQKPSALPHESILGHTEADAVKELRLAVDTILPADSRGDAFSLRPDATAPRIAYVPLRFLQEHLGVEGRCNALLATGAQPIAAERLREYLSQEDWGLVLRGPDQRVAAFDSMLDQDRRLRRSRMPTYLTGAVEAALKVAIKDFYHRQRNYLSLESRNLFLDDATADAASRAAEAAGLQAAPTLVYLANTIDAGGREIPYSVVAALRPELPAPLGPFLPPGVKSLADDQIVLADWKESPLPRDEGEKVTLKFYPPVHHGDPKEESATFRLAGFVPLVGVGADRDLAPEFPGITDKLDMKDWQTPFFVDLKRVKKPDERYWSDYRTTPKAYVTLAAGQRLWGSRFGKLTSIRLALKDEGSLPTAAERFRQELLSRLMPADGGFVFQPVMENALQSADRGSDFVLLFVAFSSFLIAAALMLVSLLFRLNLDRRAAQVGLLAAVGYRRRVIRRLLLGEGTLLAAAGAVVGAWLAVGYAGFLLRLLEALWPGGSLSSFLQARYTWLSLAIGAGTSLLAGVLTIFLSVRYLGRVPPRALLAGQTATEANPGSPSRRGWSRWIAAAAVVGAVVLLGASPMVQDSEMRAMTFFGSGMLLLTACLAAAAGWMHSTRHRTVEGRGWFSILCLGVRNAARHPVRSLLTAGLLAAAAFLLIAVEAFRRRADTAAAATAANGGCALVAESDQALYLDLNTENGRKPILAKLEKGFQDAGADSATVKRRVNEANELLRQVTVLSFRVHAGDDASCLNLARPLQPRVLGVPVTLLSGNRHFDFAAVDAGAEKANPWSLLDSKGSKPVPAFGEKNTVEWMLRSGLGKTLPIPGGSEARIVGLLQDSVLQSALLISEGDFLRLYATDEGYNFFLIATPAGREEEVRGLLNKGLADRGFEAVPTAQRLESYLAVENTYLSTFQALGGLGLVLGSLGLAVVLLRGVWERRGELALLRALGYRRSTLGLLVLVENAFLLLLGLAAGLVSALAAVAPHLAGEGLPWRGLLGLLAAVVVVGLGAGAVAAASTLSAPLIPALRRE
jgi:ABC-type lipoprotein release transport system permease subunit